MAVFLLCDYFGYSSIMSEILSSNYIIMNMQISDFLGGWGMFKVHTNAVTM